MLSVSIYVLENNFMVIACFEIIEYMFNSSICINEKTNAVNAVISFTHELFFTPYTKLFTYLMIFI